MFAKRKLSQQSLIISLDGDNITKTSKYINSVITWFYGKNNRFISNCRTWRVYHWMSEYHHIDTIGSVILTDPPPVIDPVSELDVRHEPRDGIHQGGSPHLSSEVAQSWLDERDPGRLQVHPLTLGVLWGALPLPHLLLDLHRILCKSHHHRSVIGVHFSVQIVQIKSECLCTDCTD